MRVFTILACLLVSGMLKANEPIVTLPFEIHLGHMYIKGQINDGREINIVFDTGAAANLASEDVADQIGLKVAGSQMVMGASGPVSIKSSNNNLLKLAEGLEFKNQKFLVMNLDHLGDIDYPLDAIIGANVLNRYTVEIDFEMGLIHLYPRKDFTAPEGYEAFDISLVPFGVPIVQGDFVVSKDETLTGPYLVDTGAALALRMNSPLVRDNKLIDKITPSFEYASRALSNSSVDHIARLKEFSILGQSFAGIPIRLATVKQGVSSRSDVDGILGLDILKRFNMIFDYRKNVMYVKKNGLFDTPFQENKSGLKLKKRNGYLEVEDVIAGSAAEKAGVKSGDHIAAVDGKKDMTHDECRDYLAKVRSEVSLEVIRGDEKISISLKPFSMI